MGLVHEFKEFALKGNMVDLAVGIIIGAAFGAIVNSLVNDVVMPPLGYLTGGVDFSDKAVVLKDAVPPVTDAAGVVTQKARPAVVLSYGKFINAVIQFLIVALAIFIVIKLMNRLRRKEAAKPEPPPGPTPDQKLLAEIRDILRQQRA